MKKSLPLLMMMLFSTVTMAQWTATNLPSGASPFSLTIKKDMLVLGTLNSGIWISTDKGNTWTQSNTGITGLVALPLLGTDADLFAGVLQGVYRYNKATSDWTKESTGIYLLRLSAGQNISTAKLVLR